jgi:hypothetical protein
VKATFLNVSSLENLKLFPMKHLFQTCTILYCILEACSYILTSSTLLLPSPGYFLTAILGNITPIMDQCARLGTSLFLKSSKVSTERKGATKVWGIKSLSPFYQTLTFENMKMDVIPTCEEKIKQVS